MTSAKAFSSDWKSAKNPASQMTKEIVDSFMTRSKIEATSMTAILSMELRRTGAAYWAERSQITTVKEKNSNIRFPTNDHRIRGDRG